MHKRELVELINSFFKEEICKEMLEFTSSKDNFIDTDGNKKNGRRGWEKWLQFQFASYLTKNGYRKTIIENKFKREDKTNNYIDITFKGSNDRYDNLNAIELKISKKIGAVIRGIKSDIKGIHEIEKSEFKFRSVMCVGVFLSEYYDSAKKRSKGLALLEHFNSNNCKYAHVSDNINGWRYLIVLWSGSAQNSDKQNYANFTEFKDEFINISKVLV